MTCVFFYTLVVTDIPETATVEVRDGRCQARGCGLFQGDDTQALRWGDIPNQHALTVCGGVDGRSETHPGDELEVGVRRCAPTLVATVAEPLLRLVETDKG
jgi:hypothetical protein